MFDLHHAFDIPPNTSLLPPPPAPPLQTPGLARDGLPGGGGGVARGGRLQGGGGGARPAIARRPGSPTTPNHLSSAQLTGSRRLRGTTTTFSTTCGVKQGCPMSPA